MKIRYKATTKTIFSTNLANLADLDSGISVVGLDTCDDIRHNAPCTGTDSDV